MGSYVQVQHVPASASTEELRALFSQLGDVAHVISCFDQGAEGGTALVAYVDVAAAQEAVDLLDAYPMGQSLLEVQTVSVHNFVGQLASRMLGAAPAAPAAATAGGGGGSSGGAAAGVASLEEEMRALQVQLQHHAEAAPGGVAGWYGEGQGYGQQAAEEEQEDEGWQELPAKTRRSGGGGGHHAAAAGGRSAGASPEGSSAGLWIGWIDLGVKRDDLARALSRYGPIAVEKLVPANETIGNKRFQWAIVHFQQPDQAAAAKAAIDKQVVPGISTMRLKVKWYDPSHRSGRR